MRIKLFFLLHLYFVFFLGFSFVVSSQTAKDTLVASQYFKKADSLLLNKKFENSISNFQNALSIYEKTGAWEKVAACHNKISENHWRHVALKKALQSAKKALEISTTKLLPNNIYEARPDNADL